MKIAITYFDFHGGRAEPARLALSMAKIPFEDRRIPGREFQSRKHEFPFRKVPLLELDGEIITQSDAINRYIGKMTDMYPADDKQALYCDEVLGSLEDAVEAVARTFGMQGEAFVEARRKIATDTLPLYLEGIARMLARGGGMYFAEGRLTMADLKCMVWIKSLRNGHLDHVPTDIPDQLAPTLVEHAARIGADPRIVAYYSR